MSEGSLSIKLVIQLACFLYRFERVTLYSPDGTLLVRELSFEVRTGESLIFMGPNGRYAPCPWSAYLYFLDASTGRVGENFSSMPAVPFRRSKTPLASGRAYLPSG